MGLLPFCFGELPSTLRNDFASKSTDCTANNKIKHTRTIKQAKTTSPSPAYLCFAASLASSSASPAAISSSSAACSASSRLNASS